MPAPWLPVSHQRQRHSADCLAACAAMVLDYLKRPVGYDRLINLLDVTPDLGAPASNIKRLAELGVSVTYRSGVWDDLAEHVGQGLPCIAFVHTTHLGYWSQAAQHAVVVVGLDEQRVYLDDPFFDTAPQTVSRLEFELAWDEMDNVYAVIIV
jgi:ABC-type bacteriocin/lantibiotic exporter with double-glycine peptidase domain